MNLKRKSVVFRDLLAAGDVQLMFDARRDGVVVPDDLKKDGCIQLKFGNDLGLHDLTIDDIGVRSTLEFRPPDGTPVAPFKVTIPWTAVYAIVKNDGRCELWGSDVPIDVVIDTEDARTGRKMKIAGRPFLS